ncbi:ROK family protein [Kineosporia sp. A_224]|uniref:ROK family protein n=1 Tax=Kineosporia sp. A_224 TaxID=1962180 RepID=UPI001179CFD4|nr:ROK family protein [Kineosporia sp. A_224]
MGTSTPSAPPRRPPRASAMVSASLAGELNRARVLKTLYANGPLPRPELARLTGSTRATIGQIVTPLLDDGLLEELEPLASGVQGGKPARPLWFSDSGWPVGAMLVLPQGVKTAVVTAGGRVTAVTASSFPADVDADGVTRRVTAAMRKTMARAGVALHGIGIALGAMVDTEAGTVVRAGLAPVLDGLPLAQVVQADTGVPAYLDQDTRAQALGDLLFGAGRGESSFASVYVGAGIGAGFIFEGALHRGARGAGGEVGHAVVDRDGPLCRCGRRGCWEVLANRQALHAAAQAAGLPGAAGLDLSGLVALAPRDAAAARVLAGYTDSVALGIANLQQVLGVGLFILHGDPAGAGEPFRAAVEVAAREQAFAHPGGPTRVVLGTADDVATLRGAAALVLSKALHVAF